MNKIDFNSYFQTEAKLYIQELVKLSIAEDGQDLSSKGVFAPDHMATAIIITKEDTIIAGLPIIQIVLDLSEHIIPYSCNLLAHEGQSVKKGTTLAEIKASAIHILGAERTILNIISHMCGVANLTSKYVQALKGNNVRLLDTRKTMPAMRWLDKYAVLAGGGCNHRRNLEEMIMLKDNHIDAAGSIAKAVEAVRKAYNPCPHIEVECRTLEETRQAIACNIKRIMLDNMDKITTAQALELIPSHIEAELSGNVSLENIRELAYVSKNRPPDFISVGKITHSAPVADLSMRIKTEENPAQFII